MNNKAEVKKLLKIREGLLGQYVELDNESKDKNNSSEINDIYKNTRNIINNYSLLNIDMQLLQYVQSFPVGEWLLKIKGITPDLAAGLLAYFNIKNKDCAAQFIKYSGVGNCNNPHNECVGKIMKKLKDSFKSEPESLYGRLNEDKFIELLNSEDEIDINTAHIRADRYMGKIFISHLFEEMYREAHNGKLPIRYNTRAVIIEPEIAYTK